MLRGGPQSRSAVRGREMLADSTADTCPLARCDIGVKRRFTPSWIVADNPAPFGLSKDRLLPVVLGLAVRC